MIEVKCSLCMPSQESLSLSKLDPSDNPTNVLTQHAHYSNLSLKKIIRLVIVYNDDPLLKVSWALYAN